MTADRSRSLFLARRSYRQRRLRDVLRMLPIVALVLWVIPLLWTAGEGLAETSWVGIYVFLIWVLVVGVAGLLASRLDPDSEDTPGSEGFD